MRSRRFEPVDMAVVSGGLLTLFGAMLLWVATQGSFQMNTAAAPTVSLDTRTIEEGLGNAIVAASLIEEKHAKGISRAAQKLNAETITAEHIENSGNQRVQQVLDERNDQERSKTARQEFVKGRQIVETTARAKGPRMLPEEQWKALNGHAITAAAKEADRIDRDFRTNAPANLNTALQNETQVHEAAWRKSQEQAGEAIMETSVTEEAYAAESAKVQEQLGSLVARAAAAHML